MRYLATLILAAMFLGAPGPVSAGVKLPDEVLQHIKDDRYFSAWQAMPVKKYWQPHPGMAFNVALYFDKRGSGRLYGFADWKAALMANPKKTKKVAPRIYDQLAAAHWYHVFLTLAPLSDLAPVVRARIPVILEESNAKMFDYIGLLENIFRELKETYAEYHKRPNSKRMPGFDGQVEKGEKIIAESVAQLAAARIYLGDIDRGMALLREFSLERRHSEDVLAALVSQGRTDEARPFGPASLFPEYVKVFAGIREAFESNCTVFSKKKNLIERFSMIKGVSDDVSIIYLNFLAGRALDDDGWVKATTYEKLASPIKDLAFNRRNFDMLLKNCVAKER